MYLLKYSKVIGALFMIAFILAGCGGSEERKAKYFERGKTYFEEDNFDKASIEFKNVIQIDPKTAEAYYYLGRIAENKEEWRKAFGDYKKTVELDPNHVDANVRLARFYLLSGDTEASQEKIDTVLLSDPENQDIQVLRASIFYKQEDLEKSESLLKDILGSEFGNTEAVLLLSEIYKKQGKPDEALQVLEKAAAANEEDMSVRAQLAQDYFDNDEAEKAEKSILGMLGKHPKSIQFRMVLVAYYTEKGQIDKAETMLRDGIAADKEDAQRYILLTSFLQKNFGNEKAIDELETMVKAKPELQLLKVELARLYRLSSHEEKAEIIYQGIIQEEGVSPAGLKARVLLASVKFNKGEKENATALLNEVLAENPKDNAAQLIVGKIAMQGKQYADAIVAFREVLNDQPDLISVLTLLAVAHDANGEPELALETLKRASEIETGSVPAHLGLAKILTGKGDLDGALKQLDIVLENEPENITALRAKAEILVRTGNTDDLEDVLTKLEEASPETGIGAFGKGRLYRYQKKFEKALGAFEEAYAHQPESLLLLTELVNTEMVMGKPDDAIRRLNNVLEKNPENLAAHDLLGVVYMEKQEFKKAEAEFSRQLEVNPESDMVYAQVAGARASQGDMDGAEQAFIEGLDRTPANTRMVVGLATLYLQQGETQKLTDVYRRGFTEAPENARIATGYAAALEVQEKYEDSIAVLEKHLALQPGNLIAINNLASMLSDHRNDKPSLIRARDLALKLADTGEPVLMDTLGWVHYRLGEYEEAAKVLSAVVDEAPNAPIFGYHLGMVYYKQGDLRAAREILSKVAAEEYVYDGVDEARRVYAEINKE